MNTFLEKLIAQLRATDARTRVAVLAGAVALALLAVGVVAWSRRPHFELLVSGLDASESARVQAALSAAGLHWEVSQPPGPFVVHVDRDDRHAALAAIASAGALEKLPGGILQGDGGVGSVFLSAGERQQMVRKREWQEMERLLEELDFVRSARVRTAVPETRGLARSQPTSGSVTLTLLPGHVLGRDQARTVANLVRFGLGIDPGQLVIADQDGTSVFDGTELAEGGSRTEWLDHQQRHDARLAEEVNAMLARILGPDVAHVTVASEWDFDRSTVIAETTDPEKRAIVSETQSETEAQDAPVSAVGGAAGSASTMQIPGDGFGVDNVGVVEGIASAPVVTGSTTTRDTRREYVAPRITTQTVRTAPLLVRLSIGLSLDRSLEPQRKELEDLVKAAVGFDAERRDQFLSALVERRAPAEGEAAGESAAGASDVDEAPPRWLELALTRGVEIVTAIAFLALLFASLKGLRAQRRAATDAPEAVGPDGAPVDPELLALAQVQELLEKDPERVIQILSNWAREEHAVARA